MRILLFSFTAFFFFRSVLENDNSILERGRKKKWIFVISVSSPSFLFLPYRLLFLYIFPLFKFLQKKIIELKTNRGSHSVRKLARQEIVRKVKKNMASKLRRHSNLQCFLDSTTASVASQSLPKPCFRDLNSLWQPICKEEVEYFNLGDLWDQYNEWSAYGAGVPIFFPGGETVVQYYAPYLSAIQIYTSKSLASLRALGEESESDSWSDDSDSEKLSRSWDAASDDTIFYQDGSWTSNRLGYLYFQYIECSPPWGRIPLVDKVQELSQCYPGLVSFKSAELSPASWMSIAWYPIYHIPACKNAKDLSTSFLTFHTISSSFQDDSSMNAEKDSTSISPAKRGTSKCSSLPPFGLAAYKLQGNLWINSETSDHEKLMTLYSAADSWLRQLRVHHHDFSFFITHM